MAEPALACRNLAVAYGSAPVLSGLDLTVERGEAVALLGPSGSGKTTLLYTVAGFVQSQAGQVRVGGRLVSSAEGGTPPERREVGMVFQNYALWPHMTAVETVAYPMRRGGAPASQARAQALELLERLGIGHLAERRPAQLSGGQQQRVGLARALARPAVLYLFDEPTAHLDAALRMAAQEEMAERRRRMGAAALYATHDAAEALAVADRVALLREGRLVQVDTPREVYEQPVDLWAARLTGPASVVQARVEAVCAEKVKLVIGQDRVSVQGGGRSGQGDGARVLVRPDWVRLGGPLPATVQQVWYRGAHTDYRLETPGGEVDVRQAGPPNARRGERLGWGLERVWMMPP